MKWAFTAIVASALWAGPTFAQDGVKKGQSKPTAPTATVKDNDKDKDKDKVTTDRRSAINVGRTRLEPSVEHSAPPTVRVRATVAVIDPQVGVADIISQLRSTRQERRERRTQQRAAAVELRRVGRAAAGQGAGSGPGAQVGKGVRNGEKGNASSAHPVGELPPNERGREKAIHPVDPQKNIGRERTAERQNELRMRERLEKRHDMVNWRRSRAERVGHRDEAREREDKR